MALWPASVLGVHLRGTVTHVGYPGSGSAQSLRGSHYYRVGLWVPVQVELTNDEADRFEGRIEVREPDRDRDEVIARRDVVLQGNSTRRFFLYVPGGRFEQADQFCVWVFDAKGQFAELHDDAGKPVRELRPPPSILPAPEECRLVLDVSARPVNQLSVVALDENLVQPLIVMRASPRELPDEVAGLEVADAIVWDGADPKEIDLPQRTALIQWVRMGGRLVLGVGRSWDRLTDGKFAEILPAKLTGTATMPEMPEWLSAMLGVDAFDSTSGRLDPALIYCPVTLRDLASGSKAVIPTEHDVKQAASQGPEGHLMVTRRTIGRGEVTLVAAELEDLLRHGRRNPAMLRDLLNVRVDPTARNADVQGGMLSGDTYLFTFVDRRTGFALAGALYLLVALVFVVGYIGVATAGTWFWLKSRGRIQHAWNLFAVAALVGSVLSVMAVQSIRGLTYKVQEVSVVDARAGSDAAVMTSYLGVKSPAHSRLDLRVPPDWRKPDDVPGDGSCTLRPVPALSDIEGRYSAADRYEAVSSLGDLRAVPIRATSKQFEARWQGRLDGRVNASLRAMRSGSTELDPASWIQNDLGTELRHCSLLVTSQQVRSDRPHRDRAIEVYTVGSLPKGKRITVQDLLDRADALAQASGKTGAEAAMIRADALKRQLANVLNDEWLRNLVSRAQFRTGPEASPGPRRSQEDHIKALLVLTVYNEIDTMRLLQEGNQLHRVYGLDLDRSDYLSPDEALLVGFSEDPGPARLCYRKARDGEGRWAAIAPSQADVLYRVAIPVKQP